MIERYAEVCCDTCGCACHYSLGYVVESAREDGWIVTRDGKHFDSKECRDKYRATTKDAAND